MIQLKTQDYYQALYLSLATSLNPDIDVSQYEDFWNKGFCLGGLVGGAALDAYTLFNNVYPQFADQQGINMGLASSGVQGILPATPAIMKLAAQDLVAGKTYRILKGAMITSSNGAVYSVVTTGATLEYTEVTTVSPDFYVASVNKGANTGQTVGAQLTFTPPIASTDNTSFFTQADVVTSVDGADQETLADATNRLIQVKQEPLCIGRRTDFKNLAINPDNGVTDAVVLINNQIDYTGEKYNVAIFCIGGTPVTDEFLNQGLTGSSAVVFDRSVEASSISATQSVMDAQDIVGAFPIVSTVETQALVTSTTDPVVNPYFKITVVLQNGFSLDSQINAGGIPLSLGNLIKREVRRAICAQPYGANLAQDITTAAYTASNFPISAIEQQLDTSLGTPTTIGTIGQYLKDRSITVWNGSAYEYASVLALDLGIPNTASGKLAWIYDVSLIADIIYSNISVELG